MIKKKEWQWQPALKHEYFQQGIPRIFCVNFEPEIINYIKFFLAINNL